MEISLGLAEDTDTVIAAPGIVKYIGLGLSTETDIAIMLTVSGPAGLDTFKQHKCRGISISIGIKL